MVRKEPESLTIRRWDLWRMLQRLVLDDDGCGCLDVYSSCCCGDDGWLLTCWCSRRNGLLMSWSCPLRSWWLLVSSWGWRMVYLRAESSRWSWDGPYGLEVRLPTSMQPTVKMPVLWWDLLLEDGGGRCGKFYWDGWWFGSWLVWCGPLVISEEDISIGWIWNGLWCGDVTNST